jgi:murein endopeptidase
MRRLIPIAALAAVCVAAPVLASTGGVEQAETEPIAWRQSLAVGAPNKGSLVNGVQLPAEGTDFFTYDPIFEVSPNRDWRRWGADTTIRSLLTVLAEWRAANPGAPRVGIADISRPEGGFFGRRYGGLGHASHQNGLDVDIAYPRLDRAELPISSVGEIDRALSADLVRRFVRAGAVYVFVGPKTGLRRGPKKVVQKLVFHDDHMHVRFQGGRAAGRTG